MKPVRLRVRSDRILTEDPRTAERKHADGVAIDPNETWPAWDEIRAAQPNVTDNTDTGMLLTLHRDEDVIWCNVSGQVFIPQSAYRLQQRLLVIAHAGAAGHRGQTVTLQALRSKFVWPDMEEQVRQFAGIVYYVVRRGRVRLYPRHSERRCVETAREFRYTWIT